VETDDRLDAFLADRLRLSRNRVSELIDAGDVRIDGKPVRKSRRPRCGETIEVWLPPPPVTSLEPEPIPVPIVYEDEHLVVVDKPSGLVVHPAAGHRTGTLVNGLLHRLGSLSSIGEPHRPGIVHRLDKDTSGLMVVARTDAAHGGLARELTERRMRRGYLAAAWGHLEPGNQTIDRPIGRDPKHRQRMAVVEDGRRAITHVRRLERWRAADLLALRLHTGRTHQIRVHLRSTGHPLVADPLYGAAWERGFLGAGGRWAADLAQRAGRLFLHSARLSFRHPSSGEPLSFTSPLPEPLSSAVSWARESEGEGPS
jgi:23S rRNA pseudouridine1911/1915/1917 synthase